MLLVKITVLGSGVVGLCSAYYLVKKGHSVTVVDAAQGVGMGASYGNGGQLSYGLADPLAKPALLKKLPSIFLNADSALMFKHPINFRTVKWGLKFLRECSSSRHKKNTLDLLNLALESKELLESMRQDIEDDFSYVKRSKIVLYEDAESLANEVSFLPQKLQNGSDNIFLSFSEAADLEPAIKSLKFDIKGAIYSEQDEVGDSLIFCQNLFKWLQNNNTQFAFNRSVKKLGIWKNKVTGYFSEGNFYQTDLIVSCLGPFTDKLIKHSTPVLPVKGYSLTLNPGEREFSTSITLAEKKILFTRLGEKVRITGFADFVDLSNYKEKERLDLLISLSQEIAPDLADYNSGQLISWSGFRPLTPSSFPIIGPSSKEGLYINSGQGFYGWTLACASGHRLANFF